MRLVKPVFDFTRALEPDSLAAKSPAHVANTHKIGGRQPDGGTNLHPEQSCLAPKTHWASAQFIGSLQNVLFQLIQLRDRVGLRQLAQEFLFGNFVARGTMST